MFHKIAESLDPSRHGRSFSSIRLAAAALAGLTVAITAEQYNPMGIALGLGATAIALILWVQVRQSARHLISRSELVRQAAIQAEQHYISVLWRIVRIVEARDRYTHGHSARVGQLGGRIGKELGLEPRRCEALVIAGELLDIGLLAVGDDILNKRFGFGQREMRTVQKHSEISYEVLKPLVALADVMDGVRYHHERMNGTGYPRGLSGEDIPLEARILAVADSYDAMTHDRPHRPAIPPIYAMAEMRRCTPAGYDEQCVAAMARVLDLPDMEPSPSAPSAPGDSVSAASGADSGSARPQAYAHAARMLPDEAPDNGPSAA